MDINLIPDLEELQNMTEEQINAIIDPEDRVMPLPDVAKLRPLSGDVFPTGIPLLDEAMAGGLRFGDLVVISGVSGHGKTTYAQTITYQFNKLGLSTLFFSYEVTPERLHEKFMNMGMDEDYIGIYAPKKNTSGSLDWIEKKILETKKKYAVEMVCIDHIGFTTPTDVKTSDNETIQLRKVARELKQLANKLNIIIILLAHVKKTERNIEPDMQDVSSSSGIFQECDYLFMVHRLTNDQVNNKPRMKTFTDMDTEEDIYSPYNTIRLLKNRLNGQTKRVKTELKNHRFVQYEKPK